MDVCNTGDCNDRSDGCFLYLNLLETVKLIKLCDADSLGLGIIVMVDDNNILIYTDGTVIDLADSDTSDIFIVSIVLISTCVPASGSPSGAGI